MTSEERRQLKNKLWDIANELRGKMAADEFRDYILGFIFFKYLSDRMVVFANKILLEDGITYDDIDASFDQRDEYLAEIKQASLNELGYFLAPNELFSYIATQGQMLVKANDSESHNDGDDSKDISKDDEPIESKFILADLQTVLNNIESSTMGTESEEDFIQLFEDMDLTSSKLGNTVKQKNILIAKILAHLNAIKFDVTRGDVLGDAYEYLIAEFASGAGKKAGEFYTPQAVSEILARIVTSRTTQLKSVYDPTCGSGSLLLRVVRHADDNLIHVYGQEQNRTTFNLARMNMILHGMHYRNFTLKQEDTLEYPQFELSMRFDAIVANPPFSAHWSANALFESDDRFSQYGRLAPKSKADFAFVQHMLHHLSDNGTMCVILPHGVLFRGGAEGHIRRFLIEDKNWLDAVIGLPANIFFGTSIPTCLLVFKKCREHGDDVLFIDASEHYDKRTNQNYLLPEHIERLITSYEARESVDKYSQVASLQDIADNDYNLNIPRYVDTFEPEPRVDIQAVASELKALNTQMQATEVEIIKYCNELGIEAPF